MHKAVPHTLLLAFLATGCVLSGCGRPAHDPARPAPRAKTPPAAVVPDREWTAEEISRDPQAYMKWADARIQSQMADRRQRLATLSARLTDIRTRQANLADSISQIENLHNRMKTAVQRADDEDRWPVKIGGQSFSIAQANAIIAQTRKYADERQPLLKSFDQAVARLEDGERVLNKDLDNLAALRDKLALDLERVRLNQGLDELQRLRNTESEIAGYSKALSQMADEALIMTSLPAGEGEQKVDVNSFLVAPKP